jgi:hypothetical protein
VGCCLFRTIEKIRKVVKVSSYKERQRAKGKKHPNARLNLFPHPQPLSHFWERGDIILVPLLPKMGEGVRG